MVDFSKAYNRIDEYIKTRMTEDKTPGVGLAITDRNETLRAIGYGYSNLDSQTPLTGDTLLEIASIGKSFVSFGLLQEYDAGRLDLHKPVSEYLPWFKVQSDYEPITIHHLLNHTSGITMGVDKGPHGLCEVWDLRNTRTAWAPGSAYYYSNVGYKVLGFVLENITGKLLKDVFEPRILNPLGMTSTHGSILQDSWREMATGYRAFYDDRPPHHSHPLRPVTWHEYSGGDGPIASTPRDMANYVRMILNQGKGPNSQIVSEKAFGLMTQRYAVESTWDSSEAYYGYGLRVSDVDCHVPVKTSDLEDRVSPKDSNTQSPGYIGHSGGAFGYSSNMFADMNQGIGVVVIFNSDGPPGTHSVSHDIARFVLRVMTAEMNGDELPFVPTIVDLTKVENASEYAGVYKSADTALTFVSDGDSLSLEHGGERIVLEQRGVDRFYVPHNDFELFHVEFGRVDGEVVEVFHGNDWLVNSKYSGPLTFDYPKEWDAYVGKYGTSNQWFPCLRVLLRKGMLYIPDQGVSLPAKGLLSRPLTEIGEGEFGDVSTPERIKFDTIAEGKAFRVSVTGSDFVRLFTP